MYRLQNLLSLLNLLGFTYSIKPPAGRVMAVGDGVVSSTVHSLQTFRSGELETVKCPQV